MLGFTACQVVAVPQTRTQILEAARAMFEERGYYGAGLEAVAKKAGVSRQAIYLHFPSKAELLTALHLHIFATDVVPVLERHPITEAMTALDALDAMIAVDVEVVCQGVADPRGPRDRPDGSTRRSRRPCARARRSATANCSTSGAGSSERARCHRGSVPARRGHAVGSHQRWHLPSLVIERGWSLDRYRRWVRDTIRLQIGAG